MTKQRKPTTSTSTATSSPTPRASTRTGQTPTRGDLRIWIYDLRKSGVCPTVVFMSQDFKDRTFRFSMRIVHLIEALPSNVFGEIFGKQLLRCATSIGANYRAACRAKSDKDFLNKMKICEEESDETLYILLIIYLVLLILLSKLSDYISTNLYISIIII